MSLVLICIVPSEREIASLSDVGLALVRAQQLLTKGIPCGEDQEEERFDYFVRKASAAPFLALDKSRSDSRHWHQAGINVEQALDAILPSNIMRTVKQKLPDIQAIMQSTAKTTPKSFFKAVNDAGERKIVDFAIMRSPSFQVSKFEVYYVKIEAKFSSHGRFGIYSTSYDLYAKYCINEYSVLTSFLLSEMKFASEKSHEEMEKWLKNTVH